VPTEVVLNDGSAWGFLPGGIGIAIAAVLLIVGRGSGSPAQQADQVTVAKGLSEG
jgi:hypothetical protein